MTHLIVSEAEEPTDGDASATPPLLSGEAADPAERLMAAAEAAAEELTPPAAPPSLLII